jgi:hypothetical protein
MTMGWITQGQAFAVRPIGQPSRARAGLVAPYRSDVLQLFVSQKVEALA